MRGGGWCWSGKELGIVVTKISTLYNFYQCRVLDDRLAAILSGETELALGTIRVKINILTV